MDARVADRKTEGVLTSCARGRLLYTARHRAALTWCPFKSLHGMMFRWTVRPLLSHFLCWCTILPISVIFLLHWEKNFGLMNGEYGVQYQPYCSVHLTEFSFLGNVISVQATELFPLFSLVWALGTLTEDTVSQNWERGHMNRAVRPILNTELYGLPNRFFFHSLWFFYSAIWRICW